ncbi:CGNR zinc finger domain-containing protein [Kribbella kalugense]|uniref:Putative RNA-binding Zn ribbon-like protein n=1 Tax=Kribbella kalugense TaxID=2512221 RepID=A0A4R7ZVY3_9ACTN|nr:CGNR zinc finger domain-containing protein [Kribbella kalugense]TDW21221.1 putative RNA-binding Zn ribbon-like protein [Kribbella kalugense]
MTYRPELIGGHLALDLVNTVAWRFDPGRTVDRFADLSNVEQWLLAAGVATDRAVVTPQLRDDLVAARDVAYDILGPLAIGDRPGRAKIGALQGLISEVVRTASPEVIPFGWRADDPGLAVRLAVWRLFEDEDLGRLRRCGDDGCGWLFLDRSKNGSRRWCSSADCGNRARARRHYARARDGSTA